MTTGDLATLEAERLVAQDRLDRERSSSDRNRLGQFATPPPLARAVVALAAGWRAERGDTSPIRFLDPAVGSGAFWGATLARFGRDAVARAVGVEVDPVVASVARSVWGGRGLDLVEGDFTQLEPPTDPTDPTDQFNLIVANPPYVRHHHLARAVKPELARRVAARLGLAVSGLTGLYGYFLLLADAWLADGGMGVWLVPSEFLDVNYGQALRNYLTSRVTLLQVHRFRPAEGQFADALVTSAVVVLVKQVSGSGHRVRLTTGPALDRPDRSESVAVADLRGSAKWSRFTEGSAPGIVAGSATLGDLFTIKRGIATGSNRFFVMTRAQADARGLPPACLRPILPSPRYIRSSLIEADADGFPRVDPALVLLACGRGEMTESSPALAAYLATGEAQAVHQGYLTSRRTPWYAQEERPPAPFLCSYMARPRPDRPSPIRFFWNQSRATAANVYLLLYPRPELQARLAARPDLHALVFDRLQAIPAATLTAGGRVYGGGLHKVEPRELAAIPIGDLGVDLG